MPSQQVSRGDRESLLPEERLRRRAEFLRCYGQGRRRHGRLVVLHVLQRENEAAHPRLGITVTRKVGGAVVRHKIKRRVREIYRRWGQRQQLPPYDIVIHVKPTASRADFTTLESEMHRLLQTLMSRERQAG